MHLQWKVWTTYFVLQSLHKALLSTILYYKACTKYLPILLCTTKLAQSISQYNFALQSLHKARPSTTLYYKACTKHFPVLLCTCTIKLAQSTFQIVPVLLCTTKLAPSTSQYYFVLQSLHKVPPSTSLYYTACTKHFPVLLCNLYCKACAKYFPVLLCTTKFTQNTFHLVTYHYRSLDAATPLRFTKSRCERQNNYAGSHRAKQLGRSRYNKICRDWIAKHNRNTRKGVKNSSFKTGSRRQSRKTIILILKHFSREFQKRKSPAPKLTKSADKSLSQPWCSHSTTIYDIQLRKTLCCALFILKSYALYRVAGDPRIGYDLGVGTGTYGG